MTAADRARSLSPRSAAFLVIDCLDFFVMPSFLQSNTTIRGLGALYGGSLLSRAWTMVIPTIPVLAKHFGISAGAAAQIVTAMRVVVRARFEIVC